MNAIKKIYCRVFQTGMRIALPFLPYREPKLIEGVGGVPAVLQEHGIDCVMLVTDAGVHGLGLTAHLEEKLKAAGIRCIVYDRTVANPTVANVEEARALYLENGAVRRDPPFMCILLPLLLPLFVPPGGHLLLLLPGGLGCRPSG